MVCAAPGRSAWFLGRRPAAEGGGQRCRLVPGGALCSWPSTRQLSVPSTNALTRMSDRNRVCRGFQPELLRTARGVASEHFGGLQISGET